MKELNKILAQKTSILVGQSGVGKSSIIQQLIPNLAMRIGELSRAGQQGKHTTTTTRLYHLSCNGNLIDSPGTRSCSLWPMPLAKIAACFIEFSPYLGHCRFNNCQHLTEPGCAILESIKDGAIVKTRYESYQRLKGTYSL
jgi:ribosome biogenesis GTPase